MTHNNYLEKILISGGSGFIGTNLISYLLKNYPAYKLLNVDISEPRNKSQKIYWEKCDIKNIYSLSAIFKKFKPTIVLHLAAKASLIGDRMDDFPDNILGTQNIVDSIKKFGLVKKFLHTSTQYVYTPGEYPESETEFSPYTAYGASKAESEKIVRNANLNCEWVIIRPTNIWGPWHSVFPYELWPYLSKRFYLHPGFKPINKHYGFISNSVQQIDKLLHCENTSLMNQVYYITDPPIDNYDWMNAFSIALSGKSIRIIPRTIWKLMAIGGDIFKSVGIKSPVDSERYFRLTVNENLPFQKIIDLTGNPLYSLDQGVSISLDWIKNNFPSLIVIK